MIRRLNDAQDHVAWKEFYRVYGRIIERLARKSGLSPQEAEEAVQDTFVSMFKKFPEFKFDPGAGSFRSWLLKLARWRISNLVTRRVNYEKTHPMASLPWRPDESSRTPAEHRIPAPDLDHTQNISNEEWQRAAIPIALDRLRKRAKPKQFQVYYLHVIKRQPPSVVAQALGVSIGNVYVLKYRLGRMFRQILDSLESRPL